MEHASIRLTATAPARTMHIDRQLRKCHR